MPAPETINALDRKLRNFGGTLSPQDRGVMDWLFSRNQPEFREIIHTIDAGLIDDGEALRASFQARTEPD